MTNVTELLSTGSILVRHRLPASERPEHPFGPRHADATENICLACRQFFAEGDYSVLVPLGPGDDEEAQEKAAAGQWFNAVAVEIHLACASGQDPQAT